MSAAPHPRVLFEDVPADLLDQFKTLVGTWGLIESPKWRLHPSDWDLIVSFNETPYQSEQLHALTFGAKTYPAFYVRSVGYMQSHQPKRESTLLAREVQIADEVEAPELRRLVERTIVSRDPGSGNRTGIVDVPAETLPLVTAGVEGALWAAILDYGERIVWALPADTTGHVEWLVHVMSILREGAPDKFPAGPDWRRRSDWTTPSIRRALGDLDAVEQERESRLADLDAREAVARASVETAISSGAAGMLRLLTEQGDELLAAVAAAFRSLGFEAKDMDDHHDEKTGAKLEDLRVSYTPAGGSTWTALAEVKGYGKGAKANDVGQIIGRPPLVFLKETGREADTLWHIVNSNREQDPSVRPKALTSGGDLVTLADAGGCFIDTRDLFRAWRDVEEGIATAEEVRTSLMAGRERWEWPAEKASS